MIVAALDGSRNDALLALSRQRNTGRSEFRVDRGCDFFALPRRLGETTVYGVSRGDEVLASVSVSRQLRFVSGKPMRVPYVNDLRTHPRAPGMALPLLVRHVLRRESADPGHLGNTPKPPGWVFATVLSGNPLEAPLLSVARCVFGDVRSLGRVDHVSYSSSGIAEEPSDVTVEVISASEGVALYLGGARARPFAPIDPRGWNGLRGHWLVARRETSVLAVTLAATEPDRTVVSTAKDEALDIGHLAYFIALEERDEEAAEQAFLAFLARAPWARWPIVCRGRAEGAPGRGGTTVLASTTYAFGPAPLDLSLGLPELTLI